VHDPAATVPALAPEAELPAFDGREPERYVLQAEELAQAGESDDASPEEKEKAKKLKEALAKRNGGAGEGKEKDSMGMGMGSPAAPMGTTQTGGML